MDHPRCPMCPRVSQGPSLPGQGASHPGCPAHGASREARSVARATARSLPMVNGNVHGSSNGGTVPYKATFCGDIPLHRPYIGLI